jgi:hypothetical protein
MQRLLIILVSGASIATASGNDGFYQGAGSSLIPVNNPYLRVREEMLVITPIKTPACYAVMINGKPLLRELTSPYVQAATDKVEIGAKVECKGKLVTFSPRWRAEVEYEVEASRDQNDILIGFPIPYWTAEFHTTDGLYSVNAPGVANFKTYINDRLVSPVGMKVLTDALKYSKDKLFYSNDLPGFTWMSSFQSQHKYKLRTEYDFGSSMSVDFYPNREYVDGEKPWFKMRGIDKYQNIGGAERIIYFLTPINSWSPPPPTMIKIVVRLPAVVPATHVVPTELKPSCVMLSEIQYEITNQNPRHELRLSMPDTGYFGGKSLSAEDFELLRTLLSG